ncbi:molybdate transport system permease protein [Herbihabitans rhizosphaerae]|uniref:Molybdenum transport system permease n=1 Tax=Herbihabitans rhizosphaerae TaxID=1872711 RepID=A0A4Q7KWA6_9PSEU|nr:ABC transporter permease [Herbihabitans rhizosphaerae]RZS41034.1 molybdate transport system permease protein [Herbihabitans rhizosphaerae]
MTRRASTGVPGLLWLPAVLGLALVVLPVVGLIARTDLADFPALITSPSAVSALWLSLRTAIASTVLCLLLGGPLAVVLARGRFRGVRLARAIVLLPLVLPPVVGGLALLYLLGRNGFAGRYLDTAFGWRIPYSTAAVVIAQTFVAMPFLVVALEGALRSAGERYEAMAATLGASPWTVFRRVTVPLALPALGSGLVLCFARALGEFGATITFAGSLEGVTRTLPLEVYTLGESDVDGAVALSLLLVIVAVVVIAVARPHAVERSRW